MPKRPKRPPASPSEVKAAVRWFRSRTPITKSQWEQLTAAAKRRAFTLGGTTQLNVVQAALDVLTTATEKREDFAAFKERLRQRLGDDFTDRNSARLRTTFQTQTQIALNTGRWYELQDPELNAALPYRVYDVVLDSGTTPLCRSLRRVVVRHDSPKLAYFWPPLHFGCRTQVRAISARQAGRYGGPTRRFPRQAVPAGFGFAPPLLSDYQPDQRDYDPRAWSIAQKREHQRAFEEHVAARQRDVNADRIAAERAHRELERKHTPDDEPELLAAPASTGL